MLYLQLFWEFFKTGLFAVGGGMATLPFLKEKTSDPTDSLRISWLYCLPKSQTPALHPIPETNEETEQSATDCTKKPFHNLTVAERFSISCFNYQKLNQL